MPRYRCHFLAGERIKAAENIEATDDAGAILKAEEMIAASSFPAIEIWQEARLVGHAQRDRGAEKS